MATPLGQPLVDFINKKRLGPDGKKKAGRKITIYSVPKIGKTILAARLGEHNMFISDEDGYTALMNDSVKPLIGHWDALPFMDWATVKQMLQAGEAGQILCECGEPVDNWILDTVSGMVMHELKNIISNAGTPQTGKVAPEAPGLPDYMVSRDRLIPVMSQIASMRNASVTMLSHMREAGKVNPRIVPDIHDKAYEVVNKYSSLQAYLFMSDGRRKLQVRPMDNNIVTGGRYDFPSDIVTDDEFVDHIERWKRAE